MTRVEPESADAVTEAVHGAWTGLLAALGQAGYAVDELIRPPASTGQIAEAGALTGHRFPAELAALYRLSDGQVDWSDLADPDAPERSRGRWACSLFGGGWTFNDLARLVSEYQTWAGIRAQYTPEQLAGSFDDAVEVRDGDPVRALYSSAGWIPFATDGGGNSLAVDLDPACGGVVGQVIVIGPDEVRRRVLAPGVRALLELCAARLRDPSLVLDVEEDGVALYPLEDLVPPAVLRCVVESLH
jgi:cell wall assembly regulator SMI1